MLREEISTAERRLEDERFAAASARQSFSAREQELEVRTLTLPAPPKTSTTKGQSIKRFLLHSDDRHIFKEGLLFARLAMNDTEDECDFEGKV